MNWFFIIFAAVFLIASVGAIIYDTIEHIKDRKEFDEYLKRKLEEEK